MKRCLLALLCAIFLLSLSACAKPQADAQAALPIESAEVSEKAPSAAPAEKTGSPAPQPEEETKPEPVQPAEKPEPGPEPELEPEPVQAPEPQETDEAPAAPPPSGIPNDTVPEKDEEPEEDAEMNVITDPDTGRKCSAKRLVVRVTEDAPEDALEALFAGYGLSVHMHRAGSVRYVLESADAMNAKQMNALIERLEESEYIESVSKDYVSSAQ